MLRTGEQFEGDMAEACCRCSLSLRVVVARCRYATADSSTVARHPFTLSARSRTDALCHVTFESRRAVRLARLERLFDFPIGI